MSTWQKQAAKQRLGEVLRAAEDGEPQFITQHGVAVAVFVGVEEYRRGREHILSFADFLLAGLDTAGLELPNRRIDHDRSTDPFA